MQVATLNHQDIILSTTANFYWQEIADHFFGENTQIIRGLTKKLNQLCHDAKAGNLFAITLLQHFIKQCPTKHRIDYASKRYRNVSKALRNMALVRPRRLIKIEITYDNKLISIFLRQIYRFNLPLSMIKSGIYYGRIAENEAQAEINHLFTPLQSALNQCMRYGKSYQGITAEDFANKTECFTTLNNQFESAMDISIPESIHAGHYQNVLLSIEYPHTQIEANTDNNIDDTAEDTTLADDTTEISAV